MPSRAVATKAVVLVDRLDALRRDGSQFVGMPLEGNGGQSPDRDVGVAGLKFAAGGDTVPSEFAPDGGENRLAAAGLGLPLLCSPLPSRQPQRHQTDDHAGENGGREGSSCFSREDIRRGSRCARRTHAASTRSTWMLSMRRRARRRSWLTAGRGVRPSVLAVRIAVLAKARARSSTSSDADCWETRRWVAAVADPPERLQTWVTQRSAGMWVLGVGTVSCSCGESE